MVVGLQPVGTARAFLGSSRGLEFGSVRVALSCPTHQRVTRAVGRLGCIISENWVKRLLTNAEIGLISPWER
jgi:hypothetical protein